LIDNALSFSPPDGVITVRVRRKGADVEFAIEDQGPGIPADRKEAIFERFYSDRPQSDQTRGKNSGLGLSISREIISACGGSIWAENRDTNDRSAGGARFTVSIPAAQANLRGVAGLGRRH
jgi:two-component system sensor histidine kinase ChvG